MADKTPSGDGHPAEVPKYDQAFFLALAVKGKDAWNAWRRDPANKDVQVTFAGVDFSIAYRPGINFESFEFGDYADFSDCKWTKVEGTLVSDETPTSRNFVQGIAYFTGAAFGDRVNFNGARLGDFADFSDATFGDEAGFHDTDFGEYTAFHNSVFERSADFTGARFGNTPIFASAVFGFNADFTGASFEREANFKDAIFGEKATFVGSAFGDCANFAGTVFGDEANFVGAAFGSEANFSHATFKGRVEFTRMSEGEWRSRLDALSIEEETELARFV